MSFDDVLGVAADALAALNELMLFGLDKAHASESAAINQALGVPFDPTMARVVQTLMRFEFDDDREMSSALACLCGADRSALDVFYSEEAEDNLCRMDANWSAHSLLKAGLLSHGHGSVQAAELRAAAELDSALISALCIAGINSPHGGSRLNLIQLGRWNHVCQSALDAMVPTAALLRYSLKKGGRHVHPLKSPVSPIDEFDPMLFQANPADAIETAPANALNTIMETLSIASRLQRSGSELKGLDAVIINLVDDMTSYAVLSDASSVRTLFSIMTDIQDVSRTKRSAEATDALRTIFSLMAEYLECLSSSSISENHWRAALRVSVFSNNETIRPIGSGCVGISDLIKLPSDNTSDEGCIRLLNGILSTLWYDFEFISADCRYVFASTISFAAGLDTLTADSISQHIISGTSRSMGLCSEDGLKRVVEGDIFGLDSKTRTIFCSLLAVAIASKGFSRAPFVQDCLVDALERFHDSLEGGRSEILGLICLYSCYCGTLDKLSTTMIEWSTREDYVSQASVEPLSCFLQTLRQLTSGTHDTKGNKVQVDHSLEHPLTTGIPVQCTYTNASDFLSQHWYNCYSCGLTDDKGW